jgi:hypothetical protein
MILDRKCVFIVFYTIYTTFVLSILATSFIQWTRVVVHIGGVRTFLSRAILIRIPLELKFTPSIGPWSAADTGSTSRRPLKHRTLSHQTLRVNNMGSGRSLRTPKLLALPADRPDRAKTMPCVTTEPGSSHSAGA